MTLLSIVTPVYDRPVLLRRAIEGVLRQDDGGWELVVVDDGSRDPCGPAVEAYGDPRLRVVTHARNRGVSPARNTGVAAARGDWVLFLDSDDELVPGAVAAIRRRITEAGDDIGRLAFGYRVAEGGSSPEPALAEGVWDYSRGTSAGRPRCAGAPTSAIASGGPRSRSCASPTTARSRISSTSTSRGCSRPGPSPSCGRGARGRGEPDEHRARREPACECAGQRARTRRAARPPRRGDAAAGPRAVPGGAAHRCAASLPGWPPARGRPHRRAPPAAQGGCRGPDHRRGRNGRCSAARRHDGVALAAPVRHRPATPRQARARHHRANDAALPEGAAGLHARPWE